MSTEEMGAVMEDNFQPEVASEGVESTPQQFDTEYEAAQHEAPKPETTQESVSSEPAPEADDTLYMPEYGSDEYYEKFNSLPYSEQLKIESGDFKWEKDRGQVTEEQKVDEEIAKPLDGDAPKEEAKEEVELGWDEDQFKTLDPHTQKTVLEMQEQLDGYSTYEKPEFKALLETLEKDPMLQARLMELQGQDFNEIPAQVKAQFDPNQYLNEQLVGQLDFDSDPENAGAALHQLVANVYNDAVQKTNLANQYEQSRVVHEVELKNQVSGQIDELVKSNEAYQSKLDITDTAHPLNPFLSWVRDNTTNDMISQFGMNGLHAVWQEQTGGRDQMIQNVQNQTRQRFIRSIDKAKEQLTTVGRETQSKDNSNSMNTDGIDLPRYMADEAYARMMYDRSSWDIQQKLETYVTTGHYPPR